MVSVQFDVNDMHCFTAWNADGIMQTWDCFPEIVCRYKHQSAIQDKACKGVPGNTFAVFLTNTGAYRVQLGTTSGRNTS